VKVSEEKEVQSTVQNFRPRRKEKGGEQPIPRGRRKPCFGILKAANSVPVVE